MTYTPTNWVDGSTPLNRANMMKIENELALLDGGLGAPGSELAYVQWTAPITVVGTTEAAATVLATFPAIAFDGNSVWVQLFMAYAQLGAGVSMSAWLYQDGVSVGSMGGVGIPGLTFTAYLPFSPRRRFTPSAGSHTLSVRVSTTAASNAVVAAGTGGAGTDPPGCIVLTRV